MKTIKLFTLLLLCTFTMNAQELYKHSLSGVKKIKIITDTGVDVSIGSTNHVTIHNANSEKYEPKGNNPKKDKKKLDKAKGLKALYANGNDNTGKGLEVTKVGNTLTIKDLESFMKRTGFKITIPRGIDLYLDTKNLGSATVNGITNELEIKTNVGDITLTDVTGPVTAKTNTGDVNITFSKVNQSNPISIKSATGDLDISLPSNTKANLELKSTMGTVYTDFDFKVEKSKGLNPVGNPKKISTKINGGGVTISLRSTVGNVYLRKK